MKTALNKMVIAASPNYSKNAARVQPLPELPCSPNAIMFLSNLSVSAGGRRQEAGGRRKEYGTPEGVNI